MVKVQHIFLVGAKSLGAYGGYETFINKLTEYHQDKNSIKYHIAVKANGQGACMPDQAVRCEGGYTYHNAECFEIQIPEKLGPAQAIYYDCAALNKSIKIIKAQNIKKDTMYCEFTDDGHSAANKADKAGGLRTMEEQVKRLGGKLSIEQKDRFKVTIQVPDNL